MTSPPTACGPLPIRPGSGSSSSTPRRGQIITGVQRGLAAVPGRSRDYLDQIRTGIDYAKAFDCRLLLSLAGTVLSPADRDAADETFVENLRRAADFCAAAGVTLLIETNNLRDNPNYFLRTLDEVREVIGRVGSSNLRMVFDFYHVQVNEGDVTRRFIENLDLIAHVQFANPPGRNEPGVGELDFAHIFKVIEESGYQGWVGAEYFPSTIDTGASSEVGPATGRRELDTIASLWSMHSAGALVSSLNRS